MTSADEPRKSSMFTSKPCANCGEPIITILGHTCFIMRDLKERRVKGEKYLSEIAALRAEVERLHAKYDHQYLVKQNAELEQKLAVEFPKVCAERDMLREALGIANKALDKISLGESQFDNVGHMYTARQAQDKIKALLTTGVGG